MKFKQLYIFIFLVLSCLNKEEVEIKSTYSNGIPSVVYVRKKDSYKGIQYDTLGFKTHEYELSLPKVLNGKYQEFYPTGELYKDFNYVDNKREGLGIVYSLKGEIIKEINFKNNKPNGEINLYENEKLVNVKSFWNGIKLFEMILLDSSVVKSIVVASIGDSIWQGQDSLNIKMRTSCPGKMFEDVVCEFYLFEEEYKSDKIISSKKFYFKNNTKLLKLDKLKEGRYLFENRTYHKYLNPNEEFKETSVIDTFNVDDNGNVIYFNKLYKLR